MESKTTLLLRKIVIFLAGILSVGIVQASLPTPAVVETFYQGMENLSKATAINEAGKIVEDMNKCFWGLDFSSSGMDLPNDFRFFDYDRKSLSHDDEYLSSRTYINRLKDYIYEDRVMTVLSVVFKDSEYVGGEADYNKGKLIRSNTLIATYVEKTYVLDGVKRIYNDTVLTDVFSGSISEIRNDSGVKPSNNINALRVQAALAYFQKRFYEAYKCYEQILFIDGTDSDALYRIALMTYYRKGCDLPKRKAHQKGKDYMDRVRGRFSEKAKNVLFHWTYTI